MCKVILGSNINDLELIFGIGVIATFNSGMNSISKVSDIIPSVLNKPKMFFIIKEKQIDENYSKKAEKFNIASLDALGLLN